MGVINFIKANCKNCYKCIRHCPVKAIRLTDHQAQIVEELCIGCGNCFRVCPQNAKHVASDVETIKGWLAREQVVLSLAPAFPAAFDVADPFKIVGALRQLGFGIIQETAAGAEAVSACYREDYYSDKRHVITTSCPTVNHMVTRYYPKAVPYLSPTVSPMIAHGKILRKAWPGAKVVFAGPCISKKMEVLEDEVKGVVDAVLTFDELALWFKEAGIDVKTAEPADFDGDACDVARFYPLAGGIEKSSLEGAAGDRHVIKIDGIENCQSFLSDIDRLEGRYWAELNACASGCVNGPGNTLCPLVRYERAERVKDYIAKTPRQSAQPPEGDFRRTFTAQPEDLLAGVPEEAIEAILHQTGKFSPRDELNCGTCGYDSCREKAAAVYHGMAELDMCLPFMRNRNEAISNLIIASTPNAIAVLDENYNILDFNTAAENFFKVARADVLNKNFVKVFDYNPFEKLKNSGENSYSGRGFYARGNLHFMEILTYLPGQKMYMGIFVDISREIKKEKMYRKMQDETLEMAQKVIDKQMRVAHEIAELLGETTAETKVTLTRLQKVVGTGEEAF
ncbi:MAG: [Fe-Fe] hydrogenase large subunit C-terminal domain-containing protein [Eubacterium sp.]|nr:[Fe-Fe] hydrogenase large subunit C-terminal domain-containing protein [Eubacterium sp.]